MREKEENTEMFVDPKNIQKLFPIKKKNLDFHQNPENLHP